MSALKFNTTILTAGKTATGICIPDNIIEKLGAGKKPPIKVTLNGYTYRSTVAVMGGKYMVGVSAAVREAAGVKGGDQLTVAIELDTEERTIDVPAEFQQMLNKNAAARKIFESLSNSKKKALTLPVANAKTDETRNRNIEKALNSLLNPLKSILFIMMLLAAFRSNAQQIKPFNSGYAPVNGIKVYYEVYGEGRPIILLHGAFMTIGTNWGELIPELSKSRKVIAIELQGHGHTAYSDRKLSHATLASDVAGIMDYLKIDSADVAGYSFGGAVAYQFAIQNPKRLRKLVIISSTYKSKGWLPEINNAFKSMKPELFANSPMKAAYEAVAPDKTKWTKFLEQMIAAAGTPFDFGDDNISKITAPVLIIAGDNDGLDKIELIKTYQLLGGGISADFRGIPKSQLAIVPAQGHVSLMMQTSTILAYLDNFLK